MNPRVEAGNKSRDARRETGAKAFFRRVMVGCKSWLAIGDILIRPRVTVIP